MQRPWGILSLEYPRTRKKAGVAMERDPGGVSERPDEAVAESGGQALGTKLEVWTAMQRQREVPHRADVLRRSLQLGSAQGL